MICLVASALFTYYGPRRFDDATEATRSAVLKSLETGAIADCNAEAQEAGDKVVFAIEKADFALQMDKALRVAAVKVSQGNFLCLAPQGYKANIWNRWDDDNSN